MLGGLTWLAALHLKHIEVTNCLPWTFIRDEAL